MEDKNAKLILEKLNSMEKNTNDRFNSMEKRFESMEKRFDRTDKRIEKVETAVQSQFGNIYSQLNQMYERLNHIDRQFEGVQIDVNKIKDLLHGHDLKFSTLEKKLDYMYNLFEDSDKNTLKRKDFEKFIKLNELRYNA